MSTVRTVFGTMEICRRAGMKESKRMLDHFRSYGYTELDSALMYSEGKTEVYLGNLKSEISSDFIYATKANPWDGKGLGAKSVRMQLETSLKNLQRDQVDVFYLHSPDHETPLVETLKTVNELHKEGKFTELGLSNYSAWLTAEVVTLCRQKGWIVPTIHQGMYSVLTRRVEKELLPCLRHYGLKFYAFSPLGAGLLTGKHKIENLPKNEPGRFFGEGNLVTLYRSRYWKQEYFDAIEVIQDALTSAYGENEVGIAEAAYRWLYHHSSLKGEYGDAVVVGAATTEQLEKNLLYAKKGPLNETVINVFTNIWNKTSHLCPDYAR